VSVNEGTSNDRELSGLERKLLAKKRQAEADTVDWEVSTDLQALSPLTSDGLTFPQMVERYRQLKEDAALIQAELDEIRPLMEATVILSGKKRVRTGGWQVTRVEKDTRTIVKERLIDQGVRIEVIEAATRVTTSSYPLVTESSLNS
jgi:hypothetical protein